MIEYESDEIFTLSLLVLASVTSEETTVILDPIVAVAPGVTFLDLPLSFFFFFFFVVPVSFPEEPVSVHRTRTNSTQTNDKTIIIAITRGQL